MKFKLNKQYGPSLINLIRQVSMTAIPTVRPIAFSVGAHSNVLDTADSVVEDMTSFIHNVSACEYTAANKEAKLLTYNGIAAGTLQTNAFSSAGVISHSDATVLHTLSNTNVSIIFRNARGNFSAKENIEFLQDNAIDTKHYVVIPSRHCAVDKFTITDEDAEDCYIADLTVQSNLYTEQSILQEAFRELQTQLKEIGEIHNIC